MIIKPYSELADENFVASDYPGLKHLFLCNETSAAATLTDSVGGIVLGQASSAGMTANADGTLTLAEAMATIASGSWVNPGTKKVLALWIGKPSSTSAIMAFGSVTASSNKGFRMLSGAGAVYPAVADGTTLTAAATNTTAGNASTLMAYALKVDWGSATGLAQFAYNGTTSANNTEVSIATMSGITTMDAAASFGANTRPGMVAVFHVTTMPSNSWIAACISWMHSEFAAGNKALYPGLRDLS